MLALAHATTCSSPALHADRCWRRWSCRCCSAPLLIQFAEPLVRKLTANDWLARAAQVTQIAARTMARQDHVIICGYGRSGQNLARLLEREDIAYIALDSDPQRVREAAATARSVVYGDASRREALMSRRAREGARRRRSRSPTRRVALKILHHVQQLRPELPVIVRTFDDTRARPAAGGRRGGGRAGGARGQPDARVAFAAAARRAAQSRAGAHPGDPRGALQPVPRLLPRRDRRRRRGRQPAAAAAFGAADRARARASASRSPSSTSARWWR